MPLQAAIGPILAHPLTEPGALAISPVGVALLGVAVVVGIAGAWPVRVREPVDGVRSGFDSHEGGLSRAQIGVRVLGVALLLLAITVGRIGPPGELRNLTTSLVVGAGWPLVILACGIAGPLWRWLDPLDSLARVIDRDRGHPSMNVWPAVVPATALGWYLSAYPGELSPRAIGTGLVIYTVLTLSACGLLGRVAWLSRGELFGLLFGWLGRLPRLALPGWTPPSGAEAVLGALAGGILFGPVRGSRLWGSLDARTSADALATIGAVGSAAIVGVAMWLLARWSARRGAVGAVAASIVSVTAAIALAVALTRSRFFVSLQLVPQLLLDPLGGGPEDLSIPFPTPLGSRGLLAAQLAVVLAGCVAGAIVGAARGDRRERAPATIAVCVLAALASMALTVT